MASAKIYHSSIPFANTQPIPLIILRSIPSVWLLHYSYWRAINRLGITHTCSTQSNGGPFDLPSVNQRFLPCRVFFSDPFSDRTRSQRWSYRGDRTAVILGTALIFQPVLLS